MRVIGSQETSVSVPDLGVPPFCISVAIVRVS